jgi:hypothetical protein
MEEHMRKPVLAMMAVVMIVSGLLLASPSEAKQSGRAKKYHSEHHARLSRHARRSPAQRHARMVRYMKEHQARQHRHRAHVKAQRRHEG